MIVKKRDAQPEVIKALEEQSETTRDILKRSACMSAAARLSADVTTLRATELVDFFFAQREDWAVIHDLRMRVGGHAVQINHVLVHNSIQIVCLDTRYMNCLLELVGNGQCRVLNSTTSKLISSPLTKMAKDVRLVKSCLGSIGWNPKRFGFNLQTEVRGGVLVSPESNKKNERYKVSEVGIYPSEKMFTNLCEQDDRNNFKFLRGRLSSNALFELTSLLAQQHLPIYPSHLLENESGITLAA